MLLLYVIYYLLSHLQQEFNHSYKHTRTQMHTSAHIPHRHTFMHTYIQTDVHIHIYICTSTHIPHRRTSTHTDIQTDVHIHICTQAHTHATQAYIHAHRYTNRCTHTYMHRSTYTCKCTRNLTDAHTGNLATAQKMLHAFSNITSLQNNQSVIAMRKIVSILQSKILTNVRYRSALHGSTILNINFTWPDGWYTFTHCFRVSTEILANFSRRFWQNGMNFPGY